MASLKRLSLEMYQDLSVSSQLLHNFSVMASRENWFSVSLPRKKIDPFF